MDMQDRQLPLQLQQVLKLKRKSRSKTIPICTA
jgi:hypothetical protein